MKKILFVTLYPLETNTSVTQSNLGIIDGLVDNGYEVTILMPNGDIFEKQETNECYDKNCKIVRINGSGLASLHTDNESGGIKKRLMSFAKSVYRKLFIFGKTTSFYKQVGNIKLPYDNYDIVLSTSDPKSSHVFTGKLLKNNNIRYGIWIQHWGDPLADDISLKCFYPKKILRKIESRIISGADKIVYVSPFTLDCQKKSFPKFREKMSFVPLSCRAQGLSHKEKNDKHESECFELCYMGDYNSKNRNIMPLYDACKKDGRFHLTIAGTSDLELSEAPNIRILPRISRQEAAKIEESVDLIVSIGNLNGTQIPGKIYYLAATNKPILVLLDGNEYKKVSEYLDSYNRYDLCRNETDSILMMLRKISKRKNDEYIVPSRLLPSNVARAIVRGDEKE